MHSKVFTSFVSYQKRQDFIMGFVALTYLADSLGAHTFFVVVVGDGIVELRISSLPGKHFTT
jgi:hypothetical protein